MSQQFSMARLLIHSEQVPVETRAALKAAYEEGDPAHQEELLQSAARRLYLDTRGSDLACSDVRELVGLDETGTCI